MISHFVSFFTFWKWKSKSVLEFKFYDKNLIIEKFLSKIDNLNNKKTILIIKNSTVILSKKQDSSEDFVRYGKL